MNRIISILSLVLLSGNLICPAAEPVSYDLGIEVSFGEESCPESLRADLAVTIEDTLAREGCYRSVSLAGSEPESEFDLLLLIVLRECFEEQTHQLSMYRQSQSQDPSDELRVSYEMRTSASFHLLPAGSETAIETTRFHKRVVERPRFQGEDARQKARNRMITEMVRHIKKMACKLSDKQLKQKLQRAAEDPNAAR